MSDVLTQEISKRILMNVGVSPENIGKLGITEPNLLLKQSIKIKYDDGSALEHPMYYGGLSLDNKSSLRGLLIDLSLIDETDNLETSEFLFLFRMDNFSIYAVRWVYEEQSANFIRVFNNEKEVWDEASMYMKARLLANFERLTSWGVLWDSCSKEHDDLYGAATILIGR